MTAGPAASPKTLLLHVGTMKTGNTSIHLSLVQAQASGALGAVCYPRWKGESNQSRLAVLYCADELGPWPSLRERYPTSERRFRRIRQQYRRFVFDQLRRAHSAIISAETFGHLFTPTHAARLRDDLESLGFRKFHIVLYVRDPADYYLSMGQQSLRMSDVPPLIKDPAIFKYDFLRIAETWERAFPGSLIVRKYPTDPGHDVLEDFGTVLEACMGIVLPPVAARKNTSISAEGMQILQDYRQVFSDSGGLLTADGARLAGLLEQSAGVVPQSRPTLKPELAEQIRANHAADAELLYARYGVDWRHSRPGPSTLLARQEPYRVNEIVESVDSDVVYRLLLRAARWSN